MRMDMSAGLMLHSASGVHSRPYHRTLARSVYVGRMVFVLAVMPVSWLKCGIQVVMDALCGVVIKTHISVGFC